MVPSGAASGSCGREPLVSESHSLKLTFTLPGMTTACGTSRSGKFLPRYSLTCEACSGDNCAPTFTMRSTRSFQSPGVCPVITRFNPWHSAHARSTSALAGPAGIVGSGASRWLCANKEPLITTDTNEKSDFLDISLQQVCLAL